MSAELPKMPGPVGEAFYDHVHKNGLIERRKTHIYTAEQMRAYAQEAARQAVEQFERQVSEWMHVPTLKLRAGEMTAQEVRTVIGVLGAIRSLIPTSEESGNG